MSAAVTVMVATLRLAIYYGYPTLVDGAGGDLDRAAAAFARYDVLVFGDGLELDAATTADPGLQRERTALPELISRLRRLRRDAEVFGYIDLGSTQQLTLDEVARRIDCWRSAGADGIFFDEAGSDFGVTAERRQAAVAAVHGRGMRVFMNAFVADNLFEDDTHAPGAARLDSADAVLLESLVVRNGQREPAEATSRRLANAQQWRDRRGVRVFGVATGGDRPFDRALFDEAWTAAAAAKLDGFGWGERGFSADSRLPWRSR